MVRTGHLAHADKDDDALEQAEAVIATQTVAMRIGGKFPVKGVVFVEQNVIFRAVRLQALKACMEVRHKGRLHVPQGRVGADVLHAVEICGRGHESSWRAARTGTRLCW